MGTFIRVFAVGFGVPLDKNDAHDLILCGVIVGSVLVAYGSFLREWKCCNQFHLRSREINWKIKLVRLLG